MKISEIEQMMIEYGVTLRAIPLKVRSIYEVTQADRFPEGKVVYLEKFKREMLIVERVPQNAGKFVFESNCGTVSTVHFCNEVYYDSIEEVINALRESRDLRPMTEKFNKFGHRDTEGGRNG